MIDCNKRSSLLQYIINYGCKNVYSAHIGIQLLNPLIPFSHLLSLLAVTTVKKPFCYSLSPGPAAAGFKPSNLGS
jgi:hypothetical protein